MKLEDLTTNAAVQGVLADSLVTVVSVRWFGDSAVELTYKTPSGQVANELLYRDDESRIETVERGRPWGFDGDGSFRILVLRVFNVNEAENPAETPVERTISTWKRVSSKTVDSRP